MESAGTATAERTPANEKLNIGKPLHCQPQYGKIRNGIENHSRVAVHFGSLRVAVQVFRKFDPREWNNTRASSWSLTIHHASHDINSSIPAPAVECHVANASLDTPFNLRHYPQCLQQEKELEFQTPRPRKAFQIHTSIPPSSTAQRGSKIPWPSIIRRGNS